jgi:O-antigen/teichoic acid export membrane protein
MRQAAYSLPFALYVFFQTGQQTLHQFMVSSLFDAAAFAVYSVGCLQVPFVEVVSTSVVNVMMVSMVQALREERHAAVLSMWQNTVRKLALVFIPLVTLLLVVGHDLIVFLFTDAYAASVPIYRVWLVAILFAIIPMDGLLRVYEQTRFLLVINVFRFILVAGGMYWFVSNMGLVGAVTMTLVALAAGKAMGLMRMIACRAALARSFRDQLSGRSSRSSRMVDYNPARSLSICAASHHDRDLWIGLFGFSPDVWRDSKE